MLQPERVRLGPTNAVAANHLSRELEVSPVLAQLLLQRGLDCPDSARSFLRDGLEAAHDPFEMRDMRRAVKLVEAAVAEGRRIFVHGDYDVDGVCSTVLLYLGLSALGAEVGWHVPDRFTEGYGVSLAAVERAAEEGYGLLLTVDCGSSSKKAVELAHSRDMQVIICDHHHIPEDAPAPEAFLNPHLHDCDYPFKPLCGTGVAFKILQALHQQRGLAPPEEFLDLVGLATVADVVPLNGENRALVRAGLARLARFERPGLQALAEKAGVEPGKVGAWAIAFGLGPRLNAAGRLEHARLGVELMLSPALDDARPRAEYLEKLNQQRREIERSMRDDIVARLEEDPSRVEAGVVVEAGEGWHQGVIGITAARIVDRYAVPALVMSIEGDYAKGSARSPENVDLYQAMRMCSDVFVKWGGHPRAGGFTIETSRIDELRERLGPIVQELRDGEAPVRVDMTLPLEAADLALARELELLEPIGEGNPRPLFLAHGVRLDHLKAVGKQGDHLRLSLAQGKISRKAIAFRQAEDLDLLQSDKLYYDVLYHVEEEQWNGNVGVSLVIEAILSPEEHLVNLLESGAPAPWNGAYATGAGPEFWDLRNIRDRRACLKRLLQEADSSLVVAGGRLQAERLRKSLEGTLVASLDELPDEVRDEVILLSPPSTLELLRHPCIWESRRVHLLFGSMELAAEEERQRLLWLDRTRMEQIWRNLVRHARTGLLESDLGRVARALADGPAGPETIQAAVGVLEELGVATWEPAPPSRRLRLGRGSGRSLEESARFKELAARRQKFLQVRQAFRERHLRLVDHLRGA